jgi:hypothetical protein
MLSEPIEMPGPWNTKKSQQWKRTWPIGSLALMKALLLENIKKGFRGSSIWVFNFEAMDLKIEPSNQFNGLAVFQEYMMKMMTIEMWTSIIWRIQTMRAQTMKSYNREEVILTRKVMTPFQRIMLACKKFERSDFPSSNFISILCQSA